MLIAVVIVLLAVSIWLVIKKLNSYKNEPVISLDLLLEDNNREEWYRVVEKRVALRHALDKGMDPKQYTIEQLIEQYDEYVKEEGIEAAMKEFGITREEAIAQGFDKGGSLHVHLESRQRKEGEKLGREISWEEFLEIEKDRIANSPYPGPDCLEPWEVERYVKGAKFPPDRIAHLDSCVGCGMLISGMTPDPELQKPPGPDCITKEELGQIEEAGFLSSDRRAHLPVCKRCKSNVHSAQERFIERIFSEPPPSPSEWTRDFFRAK